MLGGVRTPLSRVVLNAIMYIYSTVCMSLTRGSETCMKHMFDKRTNSKYLIIGFKAYS